MKQKQQVPCHLCFRSDAEFKNTAGLFFLASIYKALMLDTSIHFFPFCLGYNSSVHQMSKSESKYKQYCKQIAIRKDDPSTDSREQWLGGAPQKSEKSAFQSPNTPPPSPLVSECSDNSSQDFT